MSKPFARRLVGRIVLTTVLLAPTARANVFDDALQCAVDAGSVMVIPLVQGAKVASYAATQPQCIVQITAAEPLTLAGSGAMVALNAAGQIPASYGGCQSAVYGPVMKPLAGALAGGLGAVGVPNSVVGPLLGIASGELLQGIQQIPALAVLTGPIDCGCGMLDAGVSVDNIIAMAKTVANAGESCANLVSGVVGGAFKVIQDPGKAINKGIETGMVAVLGRQGYSDLSGGWDSIVLGQSEAIPLPQLYQAAFAPKVERYAREMLKSWNYWDNTEKDIVGHCVNYLDSHRWSEENGREKCFNAMLMGQQASTEHRFINAGFLQQVSARYAQLRLPADLVRRRSLGGYNAVNGNAAAAPLAQNRLHGAWGFDANGNAVLDAQGYPVYGLGSVGALASAKLREYIAQSGEGLPVMNQKIDAAITYAMANAPAFQQWQAAMAAIPQIGCAVEPGSFVCSDYDKVKNCQAIYVDRMRQVPEAVPVGESRGRRIMAPLCIVKNALQADQVALLQIRMKLQAENIACNLGGTGSTLLVCRGAARALGGPIATSDPVFICNTRLRQAYGKFGLPREDRRCVAEQGAADPIGSTPLPGVGEQLPPPAMPIPMPIQGNRPPIGIGSGTTAPIRHRGLRDAEPTPAPAPPPAPSPLSFPQQLPSSLPPSAASPPRTCAPTPQRGVVQCPDQAALAACERARAEGRVRQCLAP